MLRQVINEALRSPPVPLQTQIKASLPLNASPSPVSPLRPLPLQPPLDRPFCVLPPVAHQSISLLPLIWILSSNLFAPNGSENLVYSSGVVNLPSDVRQRKMPKELFDQNRCQNHQLVSDGQAGTDPDSVEGARTPKKETLQVLGAFPLRSFPLTFFVQADGEPSQDERHNPLFPEETFDSWWRQAGVTLELSCVAATSLQKSQRALRRRLAHSAH